jgi:hypothetical protein
MAVVQSKALLMREYDLIADWYWTDRGRTVGVAEALVVAATLPAGSSILREGQRQVCARDWEVAGIELDTVLGTGGKAAFLRKTDWLKVPDGVLALKADLSCPQPFPFAAPWRIAAESAADDSPIRAVEGGKG